MNAGDLMYICHNYNLEVIKTTIVRFSARQVAYPIGQLVSAFKRSRFYLCNRLTNHLQKSVTAALQGNQRNVKSHRKSLLQRPFSGKNHSCTRINTA